MRAIRRTIASALLVTTLLACQAFSAVSVPDAVANRSQLPSCGEERRSQTEAPNIEMRQCLLSAYNDGRAAELVSTRPTVEGDPITTYYRVWPNATTAVEVFQDASRDRYAADAWTRTTCAHIAEVADDAVFELGGCVEPWQPL